MVFTSDLVISMFQFMLTASQFAWSSSHMTIYYDQNYPAGAGHLESVSYRWHWLKTSLYCICNICVLNAKRSKWTMHWSAQLLEHLIKVSMVTAEFIDYHCAHWGSPQFPQKSCTGNVPPHYDFIKTRFKVTFNPSYSQLSFEGEINPPF